MARTHIHLRFAWQAWHKLTSTFASRGRRGTISHPQAFCVACVALVAVGGTLGSGLGAPWSRVTPRHFVWQAWHKLTSTIVSRGRHGTNSHPLSFRVAGVPQTHIHLRFAWQAWHNLTSTSVLRGRRGTHGTGWRAWVWFGRGTISHPPSFRVAGVGQARPSRSTSRCTAWSTEDHGTPHSADSRSGVLPHAEQLTLQRWRKKWSALSHTLDKNGSLYDPAGTES